MNQRAITTGAGLREAIIDVIIDECGETFTAKWMQERLPYGQRVRKILGDLTREGRIERIGYGSYKVVQQESSMNLRAQNRVLHHALVKILERAIPIMTDDAVKIGDLASRALASVDIKPVTDEEKFADAVAALIDLPDAERERALIVARELTQ